MKYFRVRNLDRYQHYKLRSPPWIKLYSDLLRDYEFGQLPDATKWQLVGVFLLASQRGNVLPHDLTWLKKQLGMRSPVRLDRIVHWIERCDPPQMSLPTIDDASKALARDDTDASTSRVEKRRVEKRRGEYIVKHDRAKPQGKKALAALALIAYARRFYPALNENRRATRSLLHNYGETACKAGICLIASRHAANDSANVGRATPTSMSYFKGAIQEAALAGNDYQLHAIRSTERSLLHEGQPNHQPETDTRSQDSDL